LAYQNTVRKSYFLLPSQIFLSPGLVQTSLNLGILTMKEEEVQMGFSVRSSVGSEKNLLALQIRTLCEHLGGQYTESGTYPAWEYKQESKLRDVMVAVYEGSRSWM
jgi:dipeptidase D